MITNQTQSIVRVKEGKIRGQIEDGIHVFRGIPYAASPTGTARWSAPRPCSPWQGVKEALAFGPVCPQGEIPGADMFEGRKVSEYRDEDCLSLNIWTPGLDAEKRPVMVWIHGGAFILGAGSKEMFDGYKLANEGNLVVVSINYRLGVFGFMNLKGITGGKIPATGNEGLLDQNAALDWIIANISAFGGDPNDLTVFGESAGGMSIGCLLGMPSASGKFQKAIIQSGTANTVTTLEQAKHDALRFLDLLGVRPDQIEKLYHISASDLVEAQRQLCETIMMEDGRITPFHPVIDGQILPELPINAIKKGSAAFVTLMAGSNLDEFALFNSINPGLRGLDETGALDILALHLPMEQAREIYRVYQSARESRGEPADPYSVITAVQTDMMFGWSKTRLLEAKNKHNPKTYSYLFDWKSPALRGKLGACHTLEIGFVFGNLEDKFHGFGDAADTLSRKMRASWIMFAKNGNPSCDELGDWPTYGERRTTMVLSENCHLEDDPFQIERLIWKKFNILMTKPI